MQVEAQPFNGIRCAECECGISFRFTRYFLHNSSFGCEWKKRCLSVDIDTAMYVVSVARNRTKLPTNTPSHYRIPYDVLLQWKIVHKNTLGCERDSETMNIIYRLWFFFLFFFSAIISLVFNLRWGFCDWLKCANSSNIIELYGMHEKRIILLVENTASTATPTQHSYAVFLLLFLVAPVIHSTLCRQRVEHFRGDNKKWIIYFEWVEWIWVWARDRKTICKV